MMTSALIFANGFGLGASLIIAIGAQNAYILNQSLKKNHTLILPSLCIVIDVTLIIAGLMGMGALIKNSPALLSFIQYAGAAFLFVYGALSFRSALKSNSLKRDKTAGKASLRTAVITILSVSLLNPHLYLDTVVLLGGIGSQYPSDQRVWFAAGAIMASITWFYALSFGAVKLAPYFENPKLWTILDIFIGCIMWAIAAGLLLSTL